MENKRGLKYLLDTNIFLEIILEQDRSQEAKAFLTNSEDSLLYISDYSLHSIGNLLFRRNKHEIFRDFVLDITENMGLQILTLYPEDLVSFDKDFDRTDRGRKTPQELLI